MDYQFNPMIMEGTQTKLEDGIYKSNDAVYYVKDEKIIMYLGTGQGGWFKTTKTFFMGTRQAPLDEGMKESFDDAYNKLNSW